MKYKKFNRFLMFSRNEEYNKVILDHFFQLGNNNNLFTFRWKKEVIIYYLIPSFLSCFNISRFFFFDSIIKIEIGR